MNANIQDASKLLFVVSPDFPRLKLDTKSKSLAAIIFHVDVGTSNLNPKFTPWNVWLTISVSSAVGKSLTNLGIILVAIAPVGTGSLNTTGPSPVVSTPLPALVPSPTILIVLVHSLFVCSESLALINTNSPFLNAYPVGGTNLISAPGARYFKLLVEYTPTFNKELSTTFLK